MFVLIDELNRVFENELVDKINKYSSLGYSVEVKPLWRKSIPMGLGPQTTYKVKVLKWVEE